MMSVRHARRFVMVPLTLLGTAVVLADDPDDTPLEIDYYETATVRERPVASATASVTVFDREQIEAIGAVTVADVIRYIPGLDLTTTGVRGGLATAQIRGGDPNFTVVMLDGVPLNDATDQLGGAINLNSLSAALVERIEIVRGPVSSILGSTGLAGAINIITQRGTSDDPRVGFSLAAGGNGVVHAAVSVGAGNERRDWFLGATYEQEQGRIGDDEFDQTAVSGNVRLSVGRHGSLRLTGRVASWDADDYPEASGGPGSGTGETRASENDELNVSADWRIGETHAHRMLLTLYRHELDRDSPGVAPAVPFTPPFVPPSVEHTDYLDWQLAWSWTVRDRERSQVVVGTELEQERGENESVLDIFGMPIDGGYDVDRFTGGMFADWQVERGRWVFDLGGRIDLPEDADTEFNPRGGLSYRFRNDKTRIRASAGRAFKLPSLFALASPPALGGNPDLDPETSIGADVSVEQTWGGAGVELSFGLFYNDYTDLITFDFSQFRLVNLDEVRTTGAELALAWRPTSRVELLVNGTYEDVDEGDADPLLHRPEWFGGARLRWQPLKPLTWELDGQWVSERLDEQIPVPTRDSVAGYQLYGTTLTWTPGSRWSLFARVDNLADKEYETFIGFPGPGRSFRIGLRRQMR